MNQKYKIAAAIEAVVILLLIIALIFMNLGRKNSAADEQNKQTEKNIYSSFTANEIEQMRFSKLAWFSLTTDFDPSQQPKLSVGDEITIPYKLTNMTDRELTVNIMGDFDSYEHIARLAEIENVNPAATGDIHEYTFQPHETIVLNSPVKVSSDSLVEYGDYTLLASVLVEVTDADIEIPGSCYFSISLDDMYLSAE